MKRLLVAGLAALAAGCATANDPRDPLEGLNRGVYKVNEKLDDWVLRPVAGRYRAWVPGEVRSRVRNFFGNIADPFIGVNNMLQGKFEEGMGDWARFAFNTTIGLLGVHDVASDMGYEKHDEDFGQTFGTWGAAPGAYLVLPVFGPSSVRDGAGKVVDLVTDPMNQVDPEGLRHWLMATRVVQVRADLLDASKLLEEAALDRYVFLRDAYFQRRRSLIYDGRPPREPVNDTPDPNVK